MAEYMFIPWAGKVLELLLYEVCETRLPADPETQVPDCK